MVAEEKRRFVIAANADIPRASLAACIHGTAIGFATGADAEPAHGPLRMHRISLGLDTRKRRTAVLQEYLS